MLLTLKRLEVFSYVKNTKPGPLHFNIFYTEALTSLLGTGTQQPQKSNTRTLNTHAGTPSMQQSMQMPCSFCES